MEDEIVIIRAPILHIFHPNFLELICYMGYQKTFQKFSVTFAGSKGYLNHLRIDCEGVKSKNNRIKWREMFEQDGVPKSQTLNIYYTQAEGVRLSIGPDEARVGVESTLKEVWHPNDNLPF